MLWLRGNSEDRGCDTGMRGLPAVLRTKSPASGSKRQPYVPPSSQPTAMTFLCGEMTSAQKDWTTGEKQVQPKSTVDKTDINK